jgi:hypothetical protein
MDVDEVPAKPMKKSKGKAKAAASSEDEDQSESAKVVKKKTIRREAEGTGEMHETPCENCTKRHLKCEKEAGGGACVSCWKRKIKCVHSGIKGGQTRRTSEKGATRVKKAVPHVGKDGKETSAAEKSRKVPMPAIQKPSLADEPETGGESPPDQRK